MQIHIEICAAPIWDSNTAHRLVWLQVDLESIKPRLKELGITVKQGDIAEASKRFDTEGFF